MNPFLPWAAPWQVPALQPMRDMLGITSLTKLTSYRSFWPVTVTGTLTDWPATVNFSAPLPSARGRTIPVAVRLTRLAGFSTWASRVTSTCSPVCRVPVSRSWV